MTGGTASGKTTVCMKVFDKLRQQFKATLLSLDNFYKGLTVEQHNDPENYDFDHPKALDFDTAYNCLKDLAEGRETMVP